MTSCLIMMVLVMYKQKVIDLLHKHSVEDNEESRKEKFPSFVMPKRMNGFKWVLGTYEACYHCIIYPTNGMNVWVENSISRYLTTSFKETSRKTKKKKEQRW